MRWSGQELGVEQSDALPGLAKLNNLVRSVQTPDFAGVTFHEVLAKSALNKVPGQSAMPFGWTINPYRGCTHACAYCLGPETSITMADGRQQPLWSVEVGDEVLGTHVVDGFRRYTASKVLAKWETRKRAHRVSLADGTELIASGDHRFLTNRGWKHVTGAMSGPGQRPYLTTANSLIGFGSRGVGRAPSVLQLVGAMVKTTSDLGIVAIDDLGEDVDMLDITTTTGDFIANGVVSHNCFARPTHTYLDLDAGDDFDRQIIVKVNVADVLRTELAKPSWRRDAVALGTNTDPYQRAEGRYSLMPGIIDALATSGTPFSILTKGTLLRRDLPLIVEAAKLVPVDVAMSIAIYDHELQQSVEPGTPSAKARLATVSAVREAGLDCAVFLMPILPYLTDTKAHLDDALRQAKAAGATSVLYTALHLRAGVKPWFMQWLEREHPELVPKYRSMYYGNNAYAPKAYRRWLGERIHPLIRAHGLERGREDPVTGGIRSTALTGGAAVELPEVFGSPADPAALF
ncbi:Rv2578c family radical SAM protein [Agromyces albus]|uniref:Radical SAM protein n=1 Tax=Agromyces albus TaxID=205332 RepID=A0A4Q2L3V2_9MICO|nr:Rv2578c family radical SAM protein [Agromyces albus]RXZ72239.1 radical SAM protein [Agromyces albus]